MHVTSANAVSHGHQAGHVRHANLGALNSALVRGDLGAAQTAYSALSTSTAPAAKEWSAKEGFAALGEALAANDLTAARGALAKLRGVKEQQVAPEPAPAPVPASSTDMAGSQINIMV